MSNLVYLSLGSNVGECEVHLREAIARLQRVGQIVSVSSFFETEPVEVTNQDWFLNCAVTVETKKSPEQVMATILQIEHEMGRERLQKKGPRIIDVDIVLFADQIIHSTEVTVPHPAVQDRRFVLQPLAEIAPEARHPISKKTVREMLEALPAGQAVRKHEPK